MSLLEALSYGNCCLTSDIPECADVLGGEDGVMHGVTFRQGDSDDLADKLGGLLVDKDRVQELKTGAADYITSRYNWNTVTQQTLNAYKEEINE